jgi:hypothetical protein
MSVTAEPLAISGALLDRDGFEGPVTRAHLRRSRLLHLGACALGATPWLVGAPAGWQAAGWGLWLPGAGFLASGGISLLCFPLTLALFGLAFFAWFGAGMVVAPIAVWGGSALVAGMIAGPASGTHAAVTVPLLTAGWLGASTLHRRRRRRAALARREARNAYLPEELDEIRRVAVPSPPLERRALSAEQLGMLRYALDRALQTLGTLEGFDRIDQFQTSALRYQLNQVGWTLAIAQRHYAPNFHGYLSEAQRRVIEQSLQRQVWGYWPWENAWGNFSLDFDPAKRDNVMLTGYLNVNVLLYTNNTGDLRYTKPGSLSFRYDERREFRHDVHSINDSLLDNFRGRVYRQPYTLFPCEPNWIYTSCNFRGLTCVTLHDTVFGTKHADEIRDAFRRRLEEEFIDIDGSVVSLRSKHTGHALPFPVPDAVLVKMLSPLFPDLAARYWALARREILYRADGRLRIRLTGKGIDYGNYRTGHLFSIDSVLGAAREMGDPEAAEAAIAALDEVVGRIERDGVVHFAGSNMGNLMAMESHLGITGGWREAICTRPSEAVQRGPILADAPYPDVLVARAVSDGEDLDLLLYPGREGAADQTLSLERLHPGGRYSVEGSPIGQAVADAQGHLRVPLRLDGPTRVSLRPAG